MLSQNLPFTLFCNGKRCWHHNNFSHKDNWKHKARIKINSHFNFKSVFRWGTAIELLICCAREQPDQSYLAIQCCRGVKVCEQHHAKTKEKVVVFTGRSNIAGLLQTENQFGKNPQALWPLQPATRTFSWQVLRAIWATYTAALLIPG